MNLNNLNTRAPYTACIATMCLAKINNEGVIDPNSLGANRDWHDQQGKVISAEKMLTITGLSYSALRDFHTTYKGDCYEIFARHGLTRTSPRSTTKYSDIDGVKMSMAKITEKYGVKKSVVKNAFEKNNFDHVEAFKVILAK